MDENVILQVEELDSISQGMTKNDDITIEDNIVGVQMEKDEEEEQNELAEREEKKDQELDKKHGKPINEKNRRNKRRKQRPEPSIDEGSEHYEHC